MTKKELIKAFILKNPDRDYKDSPFVNGVSSSYYCRIRRECFPERERASYKLTPETREEIYLLHIQNGVSYSQLARDFNVDVGGIYTMIQRRKARDMIHD